MRPQNRDLTGRFLAGQSGNPGGRPGGFRSHIKGSTDEGSELIEFVLSVFRGEHGEDIRQRMDAAMIEASVNLLFYPALGWHKREAIKKALRSTESLCRTLCPFSGPRRFLRAPSRGKVAGKGQWPEGLASRSGRVFRCASNNDSTSCLDQPSF